MKVERLVQLVLVVAALAATPYAQRIQPPLRASAADVELWAAALEQLQREQQKDLSVVNETLQSAEFTSRLFNVTREPALVEKLLKRNESSLRFSTGVTLPSTFELVDPASVRKAGSAEIDWYAAIWTRFRLQQKRLVRLSLPVFSDDNMRALVYIWSSGGFDDSSGGCYLFQKRDARWIVVDYLNLWVN